jgi:hypothetical protein
LCPRLAGHEEHLAVEYSVSWGGNDPMGGGLRCRDDSGAERSCYPAIERALEAGVSMVLLKPEGGLLEGPGADDLRRLRCHMHVFAGATGRPTALGLVGSPVPPEHDAARAFDVLPTEPGVANWESLRARGARPLVPVGPTSSVADVASALLYGAVLQLQGEVSSDVESAIRNARANPGLFHRSGPLEDVHRRRHPARNEEAVHTFSSTSPVAFRAWRTAEGVECRARVLDLVSGASQERPCGWVEDRVEVVPQGGPWDVAVVSLRGGSPRLEGDTIRPRPPGAERWAEITLEVPGRPRGEQITIAAPESVHVSDRPDDLLVGVHPKSEGGGDEPLIVRGGNEFIAVDTILTASADRVDISLSLTNTGKEPLREARGLVCLSGVGAVDFPEAGHEHTFVQLGGRTIRLSDNPPDAGDPMYQEPTGATHNLTAIESSDRDWVLGVEFEDDGIVGGNAGAGGVCIHSGPRFGTLQPGDIATRRGTLHIRRGTAADLFGIEPELDRPRRCPHR